MGNEPSQSNSNSHKSDSESKPNSGKGGKLEEMKCQNENKDTIIKRAWIVNPSKYSLETTESTFSFIDEYFNLIIHQM